MSDNGKLVPAVAYTRKSTKGEKFDRHGKKQKRQEKSLAQQKEEIGKLARGDFEIVKWFEDEGISGWKRGAKRPAYQKMLAEVKALSARAVLCDHIDRFNRASIDDVSEDAAALRRAGVRWIVTCSHGTYDLEAGQRNDIGGMIAFVAAVWAAHEYSRQLSRRISLARRNKAIEGKRPGGRAAYALEADGDGYKPGDAKQIKIVKGLFFDFGNRRASLNGLASELNRKKIPGPSGPGRRWRVRTIKLLLRQRAYRGDFTYNLNPQGRFYRLDAKGEVQDKADLKGPGKVFIHEGKYKPIIDPALFDKVQKRLNDRAKERKGRKDAGYTLTGVLICGHCGLPLRAMKTHGNTIYRCSDAAIHGSGGNSCPQHQIREDIVLPFLIKLLGQEIKRVSELYDLQQCPPEELVADKGRAERRERAGAERAKLALQIANGEERIWSIEDAKIRKDLDARLEQLKARLKELDGLLAEVPEAEGDMTGEEIKALAKWYDDFEKKAVVVDIPGCLFPAYIDPRALNQKFKEIGCQVHLRWETREYISPRSGKPVRKHDLVQGRFRLGQQTGKLPPYLLDTSAC
jgi:DNA invertase Pin-like site-specific DNA recombinase